MVDGRARSSSTHLMSTIPSFKIDDPLTKIEPGAGYGIWSLLSSYFYSSGGQAIAVAGVIA